MPKRRLTAGSASPKYQQIIDVLSRDITSGKYKPGERFPSEMSLVQRFETSRITIGRALRELRRVGLVERRPGSGTFVTRDPRIVSSAMLFGLLIPDLGETEIFDPICRGMASAPQSAGHALLWGHTDPGRKSKEEEALQLCRQFIDRGVAGVFFAPIEFSENARDVNLEIVTTLSEEDIAVVLLDRCVLPYPNRSHYDLIGIDNRRAAYLACCHLLDLKRKRIAFLTHLGSAATVDARIAGYTEALQAHVPASWPRVIRTGIISPESVRAAMEQWKPDAFLCVNDRVAGQLMRALLALGRRIPEDVAIVGFDDVEYANLLPVPLTTIHQPCREIGDAAMEAMLDRIARPQLLPRDILLEARLVVRESCGGARPDHQA